MSSNADHADAMHNTLRLRRLGIDTYQEAVVYMSSDCHVCRSEGFAARSRVQVRLGGETVIATLNVVHGDLLQVDEASLSESAWALLGAREGDTVEVAHAPPLQSESALRAKVYGSRLGSASFQSIIGDITAGLYSDLHLSAFVTACAGDRLDPDETLSLTRAMIDAGERVRWPYAVVADKHSVGGLPGNRTTPIVVAVVSALGVPIPKTSSRAITSPAGTADAMETLAPVALDVAAMRRVVEREGGCIIWGGSVRLSPADDMIIRVERPLDFDSEGQLVASVLSKKAAAGSTHVVIDMPIGPTAKVRSTAAADALERRLLDVGAALGMQLRVVRGDGTQPIGRGIGPALEARDLLAVLQCQSGAPADLRDRAVVLAGHILELGGRAASDEGARLAVDTLDSGRAWCKFQAICEAQGGMREPPSAPFTQPVLSRARGRVIGVDNRRLSRAAKLAGAPRAPAAGLVLHVSVGQEVEAGQPLFTLHAQAAGELAYATAYVHDTDAIVALQANS
jgi:thymidine phosphorylase